MVLSSFKVALILISCCFLDISKAETNSLTVKLAVNAYVANNYHDLIAEYGSLEELSNQSINPNLRGIRHLNKLIYMYLAAKAAGTIVNYEFVISPKVIGVRLIVTYINGASTRTLEVFVDIIFMVEISIPIEIHFKGSKRDENEI